MPIQFITPSIISSVANTQVTGTITASQLATSLNLATNNVQVASIQSATGTPGITFAANGQIATVNTVTANVTTLNAPTGVLATQNGMTGICKAWANFNGGNGNTAGVINGSFNVSSITYNGTGDYTVNFATAMPNANYAVSGNVKEGTTGARGDMYMTIYESTTNPSTSSVRVNSIFPPSSLFDVNTVYVMVVGS